MLETQDTVLDVRHGGSRFSREHWIIWALVLAIAITITALVIVIVRNDALKEQLAQVEVVATERALEIKRLSDKYESSTTTSTTVAPAETQVSEEESDQDETEESAIHESDGIDGSPPRKAEPW